MKYLVKLLVLIVFYLLCGYAKGSENKSTSYVKEYEQELTKLLVALNQVTGVPAFSVAVVHQGELVSAVSSGYVDVEKAIKATEQHLFRLASVSKIVGATMLAELVVEGRLDPDMPLGDFFTELNKKYHQVTTRQLLSHISGMPHYQIKDYDIYGQHFSSALEALVTLKNRDLLTRPAEQYLYSTHGFTLAGAIYEKISGQPIPIGLPAFVKRWTGKNTPMVENIEKLPPLTSKLYALNAGNFTQASFAEKSYSLFGAGLSASASDLAHFGAAVLRKARSEKTYADLLFTPVLTANGEYAGTEKFKVGFGWRIGKDPQGHKVYHHAGATPGARSILMMYPDQELSIAILSNASWVSSIDEMAYSLAGLYLEGSSPQALVHNSGYEVSFDSSTSTAKVKCPSEICYLTSENSGYSKWLNKFNANGNFISDWPIFKYTTSTSERLLMVNKIGIQTLIAKEDVYELKASKGKIYSIRLTPPE